MPVDIAIRQKPENGSTDVSRCGKRLIILTSLLMQLVAHADAVDYSLWPSPFDSTISKRRWEGWCQEVRFASRMLHGDSVGGSRSSSLCLVPGKVDHSQECQQMCLHCEQNNASAVKNKAKTPADDQFLEVHFAPHLECFSRNGDSWLIRRKADAPIRKANCSCWRAVVSMHPEHPLLVGLGFRNYAAAATEMLYYGPMKTAFWGCSFEDARELAADYFELVDSIGLETPVKCLGLA